MLIPLAILLSQRSLEYRRLMCLAVWMRVSPNFFSNRYSSYSLSDTIAKLARIIYSMQKTMEHIFEILILIFWRFGLTLCNSSRDI